MKNLVQFIVFMSLAVSFVSCSTKHEKQANTMENVLENHYGTNFTVVKAYTLMNGYSVYRNESTGEYVAINVNKIDLNNIPTYETYLAMADGNDIIGNLDQYQTWEQELQSETVTDYEYEMVEYYDEYNDEYYYEYEEVPYTHTEYYYADVLKTYYTDGYYTFQVADNGVKDLEKIAGLMKQQSVSEMGKHFAGSFGLSESRGVEVAKLVDSFVKISESRNMTDEDLNAFSKELIGTEMDTFKKAMLNAKGDLNDQNYGDLVKKAADMNGVSPEHFSALLNNFL